MRAVVQRVSSGRVEVDSREVGAVGTGLLVLLGVGQADGEKDVSWVAEKVATLRIFEDDEGKMNLSVRDRGGGVLAVSQFTLYGDCRKGRRPSFVAAAAPDKAKRLYEEFVKALSAKGLTVATGEFQAHMAVTLTNDGPVTIWLDSRK